MKEPIEELMKKSLGGHEMSYRPEAWDAMRARLDVVSPVAAPRSYFRYYIAAAGLGLTAVAAYIIFTHEAAVSDSSQQQVVQNDTSSEETSSESNVSNKNATDTSTDGSTSAETNHDNSPNSSTSSNTSATNVSDPNAVTGTLLNTLDTGNYPFISPEELKEGPVITLPIPPVLPVISKRMIIPVMSDLCMNDIVKVENVNDRMVIILSPDGTITNVQAGKVLSYQPKMQGMHGIGFMENEDFYSESTFNVRKAPDSDFSMDNVNKFNSGVPSTHVSANTNGQTYTWKTSNEIVTGVEADLHFYKKGNQTIALTVSNGVCESTTEQTITIDEDYLLMAVNSFNPNSHDQKNSRFIPFALTQRDVNFNMVIIDSRDGGIVYETSGSDLPWDGIDMRTGKQERGITTYIWKVVIYNPELNEPGEYIGTITKL